MSSKPTCYHTWYIGTSFYWRTNRVAVSDHLWHNCIFCYLEAVHIGNTNLATHQDNHIPSISLQFPNPKWTYTLYPNPNSTLLNSLPPGSSPPDMSTLIGLISSESVLPTNSAMISLRAFLRYSSPGPRLRKQRQLDKMAGKSTNNKHETCGNHKYLDKQPQGLHITLPIGNTSGTFS